MSVGPGWFPDPATGRELRWWDGYRWTHHTHPLLPQQPTGDRASGERPGGWWMRGLALLVDGLITGVVGAVFSLPAQIAVQRDLQAQQRDLTAGRLGFGDYLSATAETYADHMIGLLVIPLIVTVAYHGAFLRWRGATPGKLTCGLRVRKDDGAERLDWGTIATRIGLQYAVLTLAMWLMGVSGSVAAFVVAYLAMTGYIAVDYLWAARAGRRTVHDLVAGTVVVTTR